MKYKVLVQKEALIDIFQAVEWYDQKQAGLGDEFALEIDKCFVKISLSPHNYSFINSSCRRIKTRRFPYLIIFEVVDATIIVVNVLHAKRKR